MGTPPRAIPNANLRVRILVLGDDDAAKQALVDTLCASDTSQSTPERPVSVHVRRGLSGAVEEYTVLTSAVWQQNARIAVTRRPYDGIILLRTPNNAAAIARTWAPLAMRYHGDGASVCAAGRSQAPHIRARGALNELALLWRCACARLLPVRTALRDAVRLTARFFKLLAHEYSVASDPAVDDAVERELLAGATVPVVVVMQEMNITGATSFVVEETGGCVDAFLERCTRFAADRGSTPRHRRARSAAGHDLHSPSASGRNSYEMELSF